MRKKIRRILTAAALLLVLLVSGLPVSNLTKAADGILEIRSKEDWLRFAKNCRLDAYSEGLQVELKTDLDLTGEAEIMVPVFCGTFNGGGHAVSGVWLEVTTDTTGLFRVLEGTAAVSGLKVYGGIKAETERKTAGILCGENNGTVRNCKVYGYLKSYEDVGSVAGKNYGTIENCSSEAQIEGTYRTGGISGTNEGVLTNCQNYGSVNPEANEAAVNAGGIAGLNAGEIVSCINSGNIGYLHTGYNVGGICGMNRGFLEGCKNTAKVYGRRDVGGIAGQMEPSFRLEYGKNAMQLLNNNISGFSDSLNNAMAVIEDAFNQGAYGLNDLVWQINTFAYGLSDSVSWLFDQTDWTNDAKGYIDLIRSELEQLKESLAGRGEVGDLTVRIEGLLDSFIEVDPSLWDGKLEELSQLLGQLTLYFEDVPIPGDHIGNISRAFRALAETVITGFQSFGDNSTSILEDTVSQLSGLRGSLSDFLSNTGEEISAVRGSVSDALNALSALQASAQDVLDGKNSDTEDLSDQIAAKENGMLITSENFGEVSADYNVGGVLGNLSAELSMDQESQAAPSLDDLLFTDTTLFVRATVHACRSNGSVSAKYDYAGGICGYGTRGAVLNCENSGNVQAERGYAGGLAGRFRGTIKNGASIGKVSSQTYAGGIAGEAKTINACMTIPEIDSDGANCGAIAGALDLGNGNLYVNDALGAVNGITYQEVAQEVSYETMLKNPLIPQSFRNLTLRFVADGKEVERIMVPYGDPYPEFPKEEARDDEYWSWDKPDGDRVYKSETISGSWKKMIKTLSTDEDPPEFLAEGQFTDNAKLIAEKLPSPVFPEALTGTKPQDKAAETVQDESKTESQDSADGQKNLTGSAKDISAAITGGAPSELSGESYQISIENSDAEEITLRYLQEEDGWIYVNADGKMQKADIKRDGKYLVFPIRNGGEFTFVKGYDLSPLKSWWDIRLWVNAALALAAIIAVIAGLLISKKKKKES